MLRCEGGGLFRHQYLIRTNRVHLATDTAWVFNNVTAGGGALFNTETTVVNDATVPAIYSIRSTIVSAAGTVVGSITSKPMTVAGGAQVTSVVSVPVAKVLLWSVQTPVLYTAMVEVLDTAQGEAPTVADAINITTGVRTVLFSADTGMSINGKNVRGPAQPHSVLLLPIHLCRTPFSSTVF